MMLLFNVFTKCWKHFGFPLHNRQLTLYTITLKVIIFIATTKVNSERSIKHIVTSCVFIFEENRLYFLQAVCYCCCLLIFCGAFIRFTFNGSASHLKSFTDHLYFIFMAQPKVCSSVDVKTVGLLTVCFNKLFITSLQSICWFLWDDVLLYHDSLWIWLDFLQWSFSKKMFEFLDFIITICCDIF